MDVWSDHDVQLVVCLTLLIRSAGFGRVEEANGTQLTVDHVAHMLQRVRRNYNGVPGGTRVARPSRTASRRSATSLSRCARAARRRSGTPSSTARSTAPSCTRSSGWPRPRRRGPRPRGRRLRTAARPAAPDRRHAGGARPRGRRFPGWLAEPHGDFATGLESLVYEAVAASAEAFEADFAMSRGMRSPPELIRALREESWAEICDWDITRFFCCVVPLPGARRHFADSVATLADTAWAMSSRMQYNSWHFVAGNVPRVPAVIAGTTSCRPPSPTSRSTPTSTTTATSTTWCDSPSAPAGRRGRRTPVQRIHGPAAAALRRHPLRRAGCARRPQRVGIHRRGHGRAAALAADGVPIEVTAFDSAWHWSAITGTAPRRPNPPWPVRRAS
ncbi:hypothetical protein NKH18_02165 [Streptomyces sp. M10(2022)]